LLTLFLLKQYTPTTLVKGSSTCSSVNPHLRARYHVYFDWFLVRGISLPVAQLFVIVIESILRRGCGQSNKYRRRLSPRVPIQCCVIFLIFVVRIFNFSVRRLPTVFGDPFSPQTTYSNYTRHARYDGSLHHRRFNTGFSFRACLCSVGAFVAAGARLEGEGHAPPCRKRRVEHRREFRQGKIPFLPRAGLLDGAVPRRGPRAVSRDVSTAQGRVRGVAAQALRHSV